MPTILHYKEKINDKLLDYEMSPKEFVVMRKKYLDYRDNKKWLATDETFTEFRDDGPRGNSAFIEDVKISIKNKKFGPSWEIFINTLINGNLFSIITTRGHEPLIMKGVILYIITNILSKTEQLTMKENLKNFNLLFDNEIANENLIKEYLDNCYFIGLSSEEFIKQFGYNPIDDLDKGKQDAIEYFLNLARNYAKKVKVTTLQMGFSDDDIQYANSVKEFFMITKKSEDFVEDFYIFDTSNPKIKGGIKTKI